MKKAVALLFLSFSVCMLQSCDRQKKDAPSEDRVQLKENPAEGKVDVYIDGMHFTSYIYPEDVAKPVLYPIITASGKIITRGYPLEKKPFERTDHPHHVGYWLNYGDINGYDFWGNSWARSAEARPYLGTIVHREVLDIIHAGGRGTLVTASDWITPKEKVLLKEKSTFHFFPDENARIVDRITVLTATDTTVVFKDTKEGMLGIRVIRALELPSDSPVHLSDAQGNPMDSAVVDNEGVNGHYLSSEGLEDGEVWGTRARWVKLYGMVANDPVSVTIIDHPQNVGYPTYWHARGYGLFAANPFGQETFSEGREILNFTLKPGESVTLRYRLVVHDSEELAAAAIDAYADAFAGLYR